MQPYNLVPHNIFELIETLWNVNCPATGCTVAGSFELIETLWNVNNTTDVTNNSPCGN